MIFFVGNGLITWMEWKLGIKKFKFVSLQVSDVQTFVTANE